jgi:hypothetical protein
VGLVTPEPDNLGGGGDALVAGEEEALEHVGEVAKVEDVVELDGRRHEHLKTSMVCCLTAIST